MSIFYHIGLGHDILSPMNERLIPAEPHLRGMDKVLLLLESEELPDGEVVNWKNIYERVEPYHTMYEFTENVRAAVREYLALKIPKLKEDISRLSDLDDGALLNALSHNWFEELEREETEQEAGMSVSGQRREVLLAVAAHIVKRIETFAERKLLSETTEGQFAEFGIDPKFRGLLVDTLELSAKADPLFIRFLAYGQLSGRPPEAASPVGLHLPEDPDMHTIAELFPHETQFIAKRLARLIEGDAPWKDSPGADVFVAYMDSLRRFYESTDVHEAADLQNETKAHYAQLIKTDFPVLITASTEGYYKEPYLDPELKVSVVTPETKKEENEFKKTRDIMAESLGSIGMERFSDSIRATEVRSSLVLGGFGANLTFNAVAQENPGFLLFLNEQIRAYDSRFVSFMGMIGGAGKAFAGIPENERREYIERFSRMTTMLHEFGHPVYPDGSPEGKRLGRKPLTVIDEVKAEALWRSLIPQMLESGFMGTKEQWAVATLTSALIPIRDQSDGDPYYQSSVYVLNDVFERGIVAFENNKLEIKDTDGLYDAMKTGVMNVLSLYEDETMTERKASTWTKDNCVPGEALKQCVDYVRTLPY